MDDIEDVNLFVQSLNSSIEKLHDEIEPILTKPVDELASSTDSPLDTIKVYNNFSYTLVSSIFSYLKIIGINTSQHPIVEDLNKIKSYMKRLKDIEAKLTRQEANKGTDTAKDYLVQTLGTKDDKEQKKYDSPSISRLNFQGTHTKFDDTDKDYKGEREIPSEERKRNELKTKKSYKVTKSKKAP